MKLSSNDTAPKLKESSILSTLETEQPQKQAREAGSKTLDLMREMDLIMSTLRSRKISLSALHAVINLSMNCNQSISLSQLASNLGLTTAAITSVADCIEKLGFARRAISPRDRRLTWISLTPRGITFVDWLESRICNGLGGLPS
jgi:DNA-binding MarR family transcriptional regulator